MSDREPRDWVKQPFTSFTSGTNRIMGPEMRIIENIDLCYFVFCFRLCAILFHIFFLSHSSSEGDFFIIVVLSHPCKELLTFKSVPNKLSGR